MTRLEKGTTIESFEELESGLKNWTSFADRQVYDVGGMMALLCACVNNLRNNVSPAEVPDLAAGMTEEERSFLRTLAGS